MVQLPEDTSVNYVNPAGGITFLRLSLYKQVLEPGLAFSASNNVNDGSIENLKMKMIQMKVQSCDGVYLVQPGTGRIF